MQTTDCSRSDSRIASSIWNALILAELGGEAVLKSSCPFHSGNGVFSDQEAHKERSSGNIWQCIFCKKKFKTEKYIDHHMDLYHSGYLQNSNDPICISDYCDILQCNKYTRSDFGRVSLTYSSDSAMSAIDAWNLHKPCTQEIASDQVKLCYSLVESCVQGDADVLLKRKVCQEIVCKPFHGLSGYTLVSPPTVTWHFIIVGLMLLYLIVLLVQHFGRNKKQNKVK